MLIIQLRPGTYYYPDSGYGACGWPIENTDYSVALAPGDYDSGANCGRSITVDYSVLGTSVILTVADECAGCSGDSIDLVSGPMSALDPNYINDGRISVSWYYND
ncbi:hypothetical protein DFH07DRAFT_737034 [Mycena maculata]|uniref:RlpA-like protein double-psi beta-barrel domain-containing protein n=1 Tax=Mycena maculata TaxID=230809 RepID=A0AAD7JKU4_9AGAR|nr:hypothetical protein DFH07DRAFT_737034 [Mycena maculata]